MLSNIVFRAIGNIALLLLRSKALEQQAELYLTFVVNTAEGSMIVRTIGDSSTAC